MVSMSDFTAQFQRITQLLIALSLVIYSSHSSLFNILPELSAKSAIVYHRAACSRDRNKVAFLPILAFMFFVPDSNDLHFKTLTISAKAANTLTHAYSI